MSALVPFLLAAALAGDAPPTTTPPSTTSPPTPLPSAAPSPSPSSAAAAKPRVFVLDLKSATVERRLLQTIEGAIAAEIARHDRLDALSSEDVRRTLELEASKDLLGCDTTSTSCLAEVANAMGAELVVFGDVEVVDGAYVMNLALLEVAKVASQGKEALRARTLERLTERATRATERMLRDVYAQRGWDPPAPLPALQPPSKIPAIATLASGAGAVVLGAVLTGAGLYPLAQHGAAADSIRSLEIDAAEDDGFDDALEDAKRAQIDQDNWRRAYEGWGVWCVAGGATLAVAGAAAAAGGLVWLLLPEDE
jgi:hypothetical protein